MNSHKEYLDTIKLLNYYTDKYNSGNPEISDADWDKLYFELIKYEEETGMADKDSPTQHIEYKIVDSLNKVKHNHLMLSLAKTKNVDDISSWSGNIKNIIAMEKMDGLTCSLRYLNGRLVSAETRGNGEVGEEVSHSMIVLPSVPKAISYREELIIDGEIICDTKNFNNEFKNDYKNPRNFAAGSIRLLSSEETSKRCLSFVAWDVIKGFDFLHTLSDKLIELSKYNFTIVDFCNNDNCNNEWYNNSIEELKIKAEKKYYPIDGIVFKYNNISDYTAADKTAHHYNGGLAYKFYDEEYETRLLNIDYDVSRLGILTPVAVFEPIEIDGTEVTRASLSNISIMQETLGEYPELYQPLWVTKRNMIIPKIEHSIKNSVLHDNCIQSILEYCPICGKPTKVILSDNGIKTLYCVNSECQGKFINILDHYCGKSGFNIMGLSKATLEKLYTWGWLNNYDDLYKLKNHRTEWVNKAGFGPASVDKILAAIEESKNCTFESVISAFGIPLIGRTIAKVLVSKFKNYSDFRKAIEDDYKFYNLDGFGIEMHKALSDFDYTEMDNIVWDYLNIEYPVEKEEKKTAATLSGMKVCITGKLTSFKNRAELQTAIENAGGKAVTSVTKATNYLINNDFASESSKNISAKKLGIPILTEEDFIKNFLQEVENI